MGIQELKACCPKGENGWPQPSPSQYSTQEVGGTISTEF